MITQHDYYNEKGDQEPDPFDESDRSARRDLRREYERAGLFVDCRDGFIDPNEIAEQMKKPENSNPARPDRARSWRNSGCRAELVYEQAADKQYRYKVISRKISRSGRRSRAFVSEKKITGVYLETDLKRYYPNSSLAAQASASSRATTTARRNLRLPTVTKNFLRHSRKRGLLHPRAALRLR